MSAQFIGKAGMAEFAVIPIEEYNALREKAELLDDTIAYDRALQEMTDGDDEVIPAGIAKRLLSGKEHPLKVWREYRGLTQEELAHAAGTSQGQIALLETGKRKGAIDTWKTLANKLDVDVDDLM